MDVTYKPAKSITDLPVSDPSHAPCPDMAGMENIDPKRLERARFLISELRKKHGIRKRTEPKKPEMTPKKRRKVLDRLRAMSPEIDAGSAEHGELKHDT